jgi:2-iminobutanoate/2-iminopropanoate deaminase
VREAIDTGGAPAPIGPYSQAILSDGYLFCAAQIGLDPVTGELAEGITAQTTRALENLKAVIAAAGLGLEHVVKTTVYLTSMSDFAAMNEVYANYFGVPAPARATVAVKELPREALVEIDAIVRAG